MFCISASDLNVHLLVSASVNPKDKDADISSDSTK